MIKGRERCIEGKGGKGRELMEEGKERKEKEGKGKKRKGKGKERKERDRKGKTRKGRVRKIIDEGKEGEVGKRVEGNFRKGWDRIGRKKNNHKGSMKRIDNLSMYT